MKGGYEIVSLQLRLLIESFAKFRVGSGRPDCPALIGV